VTRWIPLLLALAACGDDPSADATPSTSSPTSTDPSTSTAADGCADPSQNPFAGTCVETFLADCFDPVGECTYVQSGANVDVTWSNGASVQTEAGLTTTTTLTASNGTVCAVGTTEVMQGDCFALTTYERPDGATQSWCFYQDGSFDVRCDDGTEIAVAAGDAAGAQSCAYGNSEPCAPAP
jgi:hypothetical protein